MEGKQNLVALGGFGLIGVNLYTSSQWSTVSGTLFGGSGSNPTQAHRILAALAGELLLVVLLTVTAGSSDSLGTAMVAAVTALWILWAITYYSKKKG